MERRGFLKAAAGIGALVSLAKELPAGEVPKQPEQPTTPIPSEPTSEAKRIFECGIPVIDEKKALRPGSLALIGAQTGEGKTHFLMNMTKGLLDRGYRVLFITLELNPADVQARLLRPRHSWHSLVSRRFAPTAKLTVAGHDWDNPYKLIDDLRKRAAKKMDDVVVIDGIDILASTLDHPSRVMNMVKTITLAISSLREIAGEGDFALVSSIALRKRMPDVDIEPMPVACGPLYLADTMFCLTREGDEANELILRVTTQKSRWFGQDNKGQVVRIPKMFGA
jgi:hypothetical protein